MPYIVSRKHPVGPRAARPLATGLAAAGLALAAPGAGAADAPNPLQARNLPAVKVEASRAPDFRVDRLSSSKFTQPVLDTPQTIQIIDSELMRSQGAATLTEALRNSPGVGTFYVGENGSTATGDAVFMRGFDASGSIFVDGVRDLGSISRDVFDTAQVEVIKGPAGTDYGRTAPTGSINLVSKQPQRGAALSTDVSIGSGSRRRATVDWNRPFGAHAAFRLNLLGQNSGVAGRDRVENDRWGVAPSLAFGLGTPTRIYLDALHVRQDNVPDGGVLTLGLPGYESPDPARPRLAGAARVDTHNFYGTDADHDDITADMLTTIVEHDFDDAVRLRNVTRWGRTHQEYLLSSFMASSSYLQTPDLDDPSTWTMRRLPNFKDQVNRIATNQTGLVAHFDTGTVAHDLSTGVELTREWIDAPTVAALDGAAWPDAPVYHPDRHVAVPAYGRTGAYGKGHTDTQAVYLFDTLAFAEAWQVTGGVRLDHYSARYRSASACGGRRGPDCGGQPDGTVLADVDARSADNLFNWKLGVLYKPTPLTSVYVNYAVAAEPPGGDALQLSNRANSADNPAFDPQRSRTAEIGGKWSALDDRLLLTAAVYRTTVENEIEQDPIDLQYYQTGRKRVQGVELTAVGTITENWSLSAGFTTMDAKVARGSAVANDGSDDLAYTPTRAFTAWTTYRLPSGLSLGGGARYAGRLKRGHDGAVGTPAWTEAYWVFDAVASYPVNRHLELQLNLYNLFDKNYVAAINKSGYRYTPGTPRSAMLTAHIRF